MSVVNFPPASVYTVPNLVKMSQAKSSLLNAKASLMLEFVPLMREKLVGLALTIVASNQQFFDSVRVLNVSLGGLDLTTIETMIQDLTLGSELDGSSKTQALSSLLEEKSKIVMRLKATLTSCSVQLFSAVDDVASASLKRKNGDLERDLAAKIKALEDVLLDYEKQIEKNRADRDALSELISGMESVRWFDQLREFLPSADAFDILFQADPKAAVLKLALERVEKILEKISSGIKYSELTGKRDALNIDIAALKAKKRKHQETHRVTHAQLEQLLELEMLEAERVVWADEARNVVRAVDAFASGLSSQITVDDSFAWLRVEAVKLNDYFNRFMSVTRP